MTTVVLATCGSAAAQVPGPVAPGQVPVAPKVEPKPPPKTPDGTVAVSYGSPLRALRKAGDTIKLSNETTVTRWAVAFRESPIRSLPRGGARTLTRLRYASSSGAAEIYGVLSARMDGLKRKWIQIRVPGRPNGRIGWVRDRDMSPLRLVRTQLVVNRSMLRATLFKDGKQIWTARIGVGKSSTPTPLGHFFIDKRSPGHRVGAAYGKWVFFTTAYSNLLDWPGGGIVGVHGTNQPGLIPGRPSHGCIRLRNADISKLARLMPVATPLLVR